MRAAIGPRQPRRQRPSNNTPIVTHANTEKAVLWFQTQRWLITSENQPPTSKVALSSTKPAPTKRKVRRGDRVYSVSAAEILAERLVQMMTTGSAREVAIVMQLIEKHLPDAMARPTEVLEIMHHHAEGSCIQPPPEDLWEKDK